MRGLWLLAGSGITSRFVSLPPHEDPASLIMNGGERRWREEEAKALPLVDFLTEATIRGIDLTTPKGKAQAVRAILPGILSLESGVERDEEIRRIAQRLQVDEAVLRREARPPSGFRARERPHPEVGPPASLRHRLEISIIKALAEDPQFVARLAARDVDFSLPGANEVYREIAAGRDPMVLEVEEARRLWSRVQVEEGPKENPEDLLKAWDREGRRQRLRELKDNIRQKEQKGESVPLELLEEVQRLSREGSSA